MKVAFRIQKVYAHNEITHPYGDQKPSPKNSYLVYVRVTLLTNIKINGKKVEGTITYDSY